MSKTQKSLAEQAADVRDAGECKTRHAFLDLMKDRGLCCFALVVSGQGLEADLILFRDGSGFFGDVDDDRNIYRPWPLDDYLPNGQQGEFLPALDKSETAISFDAHAYATVAWEMGQYPALDAHLKAVVLAHDDPPEAMRELAWDNSRDFEWQDTGGAHDAKAMISLIAQHLLPEADTVIIHSNTRDGRTPAQDRYDTYMLDFIRENGTLGGCQRHMEANYKGLAYAEIAEAPQVPYERLNLANEALAVISVAILGRHGCPTGWDVDYNDGARNQVSGYSAQSQSIDIDLGAGASNHQLIDLRRTIARYLAREGLLTDFTLLLEELGLPALPEVEDA